MKDWWLGRSPRERALLAVCLAIFVLFILYQQVWMRLEQADQRAQRRLNAQQQVLRWAQRQGPQLAQLAARKPGSQQRSSQPFSEIINQSGRDYGVTITRLRQQQDHFDVWLEPMGFDALLQWLALMESRFGYRVESINVQASEVKGVVQIARLRFGRS